MIIYLFFNGIELGKGVPICRVKSKYLLLIIKIYLLYNIPFLFYYLPFCEYICVFHKSKEIYWISIMIWGCHDLSYVYVFITTWESWLFLKSKYSSPLLTPNPKYKEIDNASFIFLYMLNFSIFTHLKCVQIFLFSF